MKPPTLLGAFTICLYTILILQRSLLAWLFCPTNLRIEYLLRRSFQQSESEMVRAQTMGLLHDMKTAWEHLDKDGLHGSSKALPEGGPCTTIPGYPSTLRA